MTTEHDAARMQLSEMTEITERTIGRTFHRHPDLDALYRDCPSAFWLAPDGDDALPIPVPGPVMPSPVVVTTDETLNDSPIDPLIVEGMSRGIFRALLVAGPTFAATGLMFGEATSDDRWWDPFGRAVASLFALRFTVTIGALLALLPVLVGVLALGEAGRSVPTVRRPAAWSATGGAMGALIAALFGAGGAVGLALIATSVACARIARSAVQWTDPDPA